ncbi:PIN domain-containing protein [Geminocystis sp. CENA526]|uniref:PIN domain-containing protein n=1 Tax=Geminocystis sp. CENA526 TaxID=1355871 RepID=UPI003D6E8BA6
MKNNKNESCFIDSNIWLYALLSSEKPEEEKKSHIAHKLIINNDSRIIISTQVINEVSVNLLKKSRTDNEKLMRIIQSFYEKYEVVILNRKTLLDACHLRQKYNLSFWDSLLVSSALFSSAKYLYSEDMQHNLIVNEKLLIVNPFIESGFF